MSEYRVTIHAPAQVHHTVHLGHGSVVWPYSTILDGSQIGEGCVVGTNVFIGRHASIGAGTRIHPGAAIPDGAVIGSRVYIGSNVTLTDVAYPNLADKGQEVHRPPVIENDCVLGCNCVILPGVVIHAGAIVGAGSVVTRDVAAGAVVMGNPARAKRTRHLVLACNEAGEVVG